MPYPSSTVTPPSLEQYQWWWNSLTLGHTTPYGNHKFEGLDRPKVRSQDQDWPRTRGQSRGLDLLAGRDYNVTMDISSYNGTTLQQATADLRNACSPRGTVEDPLYINIGGTSYVFYARVRKDSIPIDITYVLGNLAKNIVVNFHATDPYIYSTPTQSVSLGLSTPVGGFTFPFSFPLSFGGGGGNTASVTNNGNVECYPILTVTGPCIYPTITNETSGQELSFDIQLNDGDQLVIDTDVPHSALYYASGSTTPVSRMYTISTNSQWWYLPPGVGPNAVNGGVSTISFTSQDTSPVAGTLSIEYVSAFSSIA